MIVGLLVPTEALGAQWKDFLPGVVDLESSEYRVSARPWPMAGVG